MRAELTLTYGLYLAKLGLTKAKAPFMEKMELNSQSKLPGQGWPPWKTTDLN